MNVDAIIDAALQRRAALLQDAGTTAYRVLHGAIDGTPGLVLERFGDVLIAQLHEGRLEPGEDGARRVCEAAAERLVVRSVYRKRFPRDRQAAESLEAEHRDPTPWIGTPCEPQITVLERGIRFFVRPYDGFGVGLFLDQRANRLRVRQLAAGRRVLNLFAYTCGFSVAAALGGAASTVSVDSHKRFLEWGRQNFGANELPLEPHRFVYSEAFDYFARARRQHRGFELIVIDPPTFARSKRSRRVFSLEQHLPALVAEAMSLLERGGWMVLSTNHRGTSRARLEQALESAAERGGRRVDSIERPRLPPDFRGDADYSKAVLAQIG
jgi:23S rRNA (cytosine1962-C5)-methyltransferase